MCMLYIGETSIHIDLSDIAVDMLLICFRLIFIHVGLSHRISVDLFQVEYLYTLVYQTLDLLANKK